MNNCSFINFKYKIMSTKRIVLSIIVLSSLMYFFSGCYKVTTLVLDNGTEVTGDVSFAKDIAPIFSKSCALSGCHVSGGVKPDLTDTNAFNSLNNGSLLNVGSPDQSEVYLWLTGKRAVTMPPNGPVNPSNLNQLILAWIKQGASNN
jgi:hypothetical protein